MLSIEVVVVSVIGVVVSVSWKGQRMLQFMGSSGNMGIDVLMIVVFIVMVVVVLLNIWESSIVFDGQMMVVIIRVWVLIMVVMFVLLSWVMMVVVVCYMEGQNGIFLLGLVICLSLSGEVVLVLRMQWIVLRWNMLLKVCEMVVGLLMIDSVCQLIMIVVRLMVSMVYYGEKDLGDVMGDVVLWCMSMILMLIMMVMMRFGRIDQLRLSQLVIMFVLLIIVVVKVGVVVIVYSLCSLIIYVSDLLRSVYIVIRIMVGYSSLSIFISFRFFVDN